MNFKYSDLNYDEFYSSDHCLKENAEINRILCSAIPEGATVYDLGAGTGLCAGMLMGRNRVYQFEKDANMRSQNPYPLFFPYSAEYALARYIPDNVSAITSLFALNYMSAGTLISAAKKADKCVFVVYNKPYKAGSESWYAGKMRIFLKKHLFSRLQIDCELNELEYQGFNIKRYSLLGEPYYDVIVIGRPANFKWKVHFAPRIH